MEQAEAGGDEVGGDFGEIATKEGLAEDPGFEEAEAETFSHAGSEQGVRVGHDLLEREREVVTDAQGQGELAFGGEVFPALVGRTECGVCGTEAVGEVELGVGGGEEGEFAEVFAADGPYRIEVEVFGQIGVFVCGSDAGRFGNSIGKKVRSRVSGGEIGKVGVITVIECGVSDAGACGVQAVMDACECLMIVGTSVFGEVVEVEEEGVAMFGQLMNGFGEGGVFP